jgi:hypothetical protein
MKIGGFVFGQSVLFLRGGGEGGFGSLIVVTRSVNRIDQSLQQPSSLNHIITSIQQLQYTHLGQRWSRNEEMETWMTVSFRRHESDVGGYLIEWEWEVAVTTQ